MNAHGPYTGDDGVSFAVQQTLYVGGRGGETTTQEVTESFETTDTNEVALAILGMRNATADVDQTIASTRVTAAVVAGVAERERARGKRKRGAPAVLATACASLGSHYCEMSCGEEEKDNVGDATASSCSRAACLKVFEDSVRASCWQVRSRLVVNAFSDSDRPCLITDRPSICVQHIHVDYHP